MKRLVAVLIALAAGVSCTRDPYVDPSLICGGGLGEEWTMSTVPPPNAASLRLLSDKNPNEHFSEMEFPVEVWFSTSNGKQLMCKARKDFCFGEWWQFEKTDKGPVVSKQSSFGCFT